MRNPNISVKQKYFLKSSSVPSSADDPERVGENSSFHFFLFLGGGSARGFTCLGRGLWFWGAAEGGSVRPSKAFI